MSDLLLDTDTCIHLLRKNPVVVNQAQRVTPSQCHISMISTFELFAGVENCPQPHRPEELRKLGLFLSRIRQLPFSFNEAKAAAALKQLLIKSGSMIGAFDLLIAATASVNNMTLVSGNIREFSRIPGLPIIDWSS